MGSSWCRWWLKVLCWVPLVVVVGLVIGAFIRTAPDVDSDSSTPTIDRERPLEVALGDSFIAGEGAGRYLAGTDDDANTCHRANSAYPFLVAQQLDYRLVTAACSGAEVEDITQQGQYPDSPSDVYGGRPQIEALRSSDLHDDPADVDLVVLSIGGNDAGFATIVNKCLQENCLHYARGWMAHLDSIWHDLYDTYAAIDKVVPGARKVVMTYPDLIAPGSCALGRLSAQEVTWIRTRFLPRLNDIVKLEATNAGFEVVDNTEVFAGARICEDGVPSHDQAANVFQFVRPHSGPLDGDLVRGSFHPKPLGHQLLAQNLLRTLEQPPPVVEPCQPGVTCPNLPPPAPDLPPPGSDQPFPTGTRCTGDRIAATEIAVVDWQRRSYDLTAAPRSDYCYRDWEDSWRTDQSDAGGKAHIPTGTLVDQETLSMEVLTEQGDGTWKLTILNPPPTAPPGEQSVPWISKHLVGIALAAAITVAVIVVALPVLQFSMCRRSRRRTQEASQNA